MEYFNMVCGDKEMEGLVLFMMFQNRESLIRIYRWICDKFMLGILGTDHATFTSNPLITLLTLFLREDCSTQQWYECLFYEIPIHSGIIVQSTTQQKGSSKIKSVLHSVLLNWQQSLKKLCQCKVLYFKNALKRKEFDKCWQEITSLRGGIKVVAVWFAHQR